MVVCDECGTPEGRSRFKTVKSFLSHIGQHIKDEEFIRIDGDPICALCNTDKPYASFNSLRGHVYQKHSKRKAIEKLLNETDKVSTPPVTSEIEQFNTNVPCFDDTLNDPFADFDAPELVEFIEHEKPPETLQCQVFCSGLLQRIVDLAIELESNPSMNRINSNLAISSLIDAVESVCQNIAHVIGSINTNDDAIRLATEVEHIPDKLSVLKTEHKRHSYYETNQYLIKPTSKILDELPMTRHNNGEGILHYQKKEIQSVSIITLLSTLCASEEFCSQFLWPSDFADSNKLTHPFSGIHARTLRQKLNDDFIAIEEYGDEFETCNALGAKKGKHKVINVDVGNKWYL